MKKTKWQAEKVISVERVVGKKPVVFHCYARTTRSEIIVRVEKDGDASKYAEWGMPKALGLEAAMHQAAVQTTVEAMRE